MNIEDLKKEFDLALAQMSDQDIVAAFAAIDCDVEIANEGWTHYEEFDSSSCQFITRSFSVPVISSLALAVDSNELALAA